MDPQDSVLFICSVIGVLGSIVILKLRIRLWVWARVTLILLCIFIESVIANAIGRVFFQAARGADFSRAFIYTGIGIGVYILTRNFQEHRLHNGNGNGVTQEEKQAS